jgi:hypothetical protein
MHAFWTQTAAFYASEPFKQMSMGQTCISGQQSRPVPDTCALPPKTSSTASAKFLASAVLAAAKSSAGEAWGKKGSMK